MFEPPARKPAQPGAAPASTLTPQPPALRQAAAPTRTAAAPAKPVQVKRQVSDPPYGWTAAYQVQNTPSAYRVEIHAQVKAAGGVKASDVKNVQAATALEFARYWDARFLLKDKQGRSKPLQMALKFVSTKAHLSLTLNPGEGRDNLTNWYVKSAPQDRAHELGHQLGLKDEYVDAGAANRKTATSPGVKTDHSLMGNYYAEGEAKADVKLRHGQVLARDISSALGQPLTGVLSPTYTVRRGDTLLGLALRFYGTSKQAEALYQKNKAVIPDTRVLKPGTVLRR
ncbi:LysM peptidoglycan-binding domain-containing protein [Deinococcus arcticus]|uniref:LysM domain-containing protein n=1 Tax=Deinococcus arcticus TaxID=2136176 RepID=A0A2T3W7G7_9DEIO|nr:LysM domain-containing protein [Deinococcus arcticus]PTA67693.1 hypothetical protein C8263_11305 [Deinococcus arcticus]